MTVELDDPVTWPAQTRTWVTDVADRYRGSTELAPDLPGWLIEHEEEFRCTLGNSVVLAYHCTRLLDYEREGILTDGLRPLDRELVEHRIATAIARDALSDAARRWVQDGNVYAINNTLGREHQVCFVVGRSALDQLADGLSPFLTHWGGEALRGGPDDAPPLRSVGTPAIVVSRLRLTPDEGHAVSHPSLSKLFVGTALGLEMCAGAIYLYRSVGAEDIVAIWQPGDREYDLHAGLPRS